MPAAAYRVRFANGQVSLCQTLDEAHRVLERVDNPPAEGILPAPEVWTYSELKLQATGLVHSRRGQSEAPPSTPGAFMRWASW